jgi:hypothetical protein
MIHDSASHSLVRSPNQESKIVNHGLLDLGKFMISIQIAISDLSTDSLYFTRAGGISADSI